MEETRWFHVRPIFVLICAIVLVLVFIPRVIATRNRILGDLLLFATVVTGMGWFFLLKYREANFRWASLTFLITSICLTASLPVFLIELHASKYLVHSPYHDLLSTYARFWVRWGYQGYVPVLLGVMGSLLGSGRSRVAFLLSSTVLLLLREAMGTWGF